VTGDAEEPAPAGGDELGGCGEQAEPQTPRFPEPRLACEGEPGHELVGAARGVAADEGLPPPIASRRRLPDSPSAGDQ
jgi:hypothetical protein